MDRPRDLHQLPLSDRQRADQSLRTKLCPKALQHGNTTLAHGMAIEHTATRHLVAEIDVFGDRQVQRQCQLLIDDGDTVCTGGTRSGDLRRHTTQTDLAACVGSLRSSQDLH